MNASISGPSPSEEALISHGVLTSGKTVQDFEKEFVGGSGMSPVLRRFLRSDEIADLVVFLASEQSSGITGAALRVDGVIIRLILQKASVVCSLLLWHCAPQSGGKQMVVGQPACGRCLRVACMA